MGNAQTLGLKNPMKAEAADVTKTLTARQWVNELADIPGVNPRVNPSGAGISQLIDDLDKQGKLNPLASRWNDFMAGTWGAGDPEYAALRAKMGLSNTLLMQVHVGSKGSSSQLLQHFEDLANAGKMDGPTLKSSYNSELDYVRKKQMLPGGGGSHPAGGQHDPMGIR
jgi:hypothetical protein